MVRGLDQALHDSAHINQAPRRLVFVPARCAPACLLEEAVWLARGFQRTAGRMQHLLRVVSGAKSHRARAARVSADPSGARLYRRCLRLGVAGAFNRARNRIPARSSRRWQWVRSGFHMPVHLAHPPVFTLLPAHASTTRDIGFPFALAGRVEGAPAQRNRVFTADGFTAVGLSQSGGCPQVPFVSKHPYPEATRLLQRRSRHGC